jgi:chitodextrinase
VDNSLLTVAGLAPGTAYTFYVVLRDSAGNRSAPSAPLTVTTLP